MQEICVAILSAKFSGNLADMKKGVAMLLEQYPGEPDTYLRAAETFIVNAVDSKSHAMAGNYQKVIDYCKSGLNKIRNTGYIKFNKGSIDDTEGYLNYYCAKAMYLERAYGKNVNSYSRSNAEDYAVAAHNLLKNDDTLKLYQIIAGL